MARRTTESGEAVYVAEDEARVGSEGPFFVVYRSDDRGERFGYLCSNCETIDNAMDTMGRIVLPTDRISA